MTVFIGKYSRCVVSKAAGSAAASGLRSHVSASVPRLQAPGLVIQISNSVIHFLFGCFVTAAEPLVAAVIRQQHQAASADISTLLAGADITTVEPLLAAVIKQLQLQFPAASLHLPVADIALVL